MHSELLEILRCPKSGQRLILEQPEYREGRIYSGWLVSEGGEHRYEIWNFIPRYVPESNYADSFGMQWNMFRQTQLDSYSGYPTSANRFWHATAWCPKDLADQWVLDVGCGAGRFAEITVKTGAKVIALDYSTAVDACYANLQQYPNLDVVQGDIYELPFPKRFFRYVYSLGVLQHTPDVEKAFASLPPMVQEGGRLCVDFYQKHWKSMLLPKYTLRRITNHMSKTLLFSILESLVPKMFPFSQLAGKLPMGHLVKRMIPVADPVYYYEKEYGKTKMTLEQRLSWSLLDTFDWFSPQYDNPQTSGAVRKWMEDAGLQDIEVLKAGHLVARGIVPKTFLA